MNILSRLYIRRLYDTLLVSLESKHMDPKLRQLRHLGLLQHALQHRHLGLLQHALQHRRLGLLQHALQTREMGLLRHTLGWRIVAHAVATILMEKDATRPNSASDVGPRLKSLFTHR